MPGASFAGGFENCQEAHESARDGGVQETSAGYEPFLTGAPIDFAGDGVVYDAVVPCRPQAGLRGGRIQAPVLPARVRPIGPVGASGLPRVQRIPFLDHPVEPIREDGGVGGGQVVLLERMRDVVEVA